MSTPRFIKLSNGVIFKLDAVRMVARRDLNEYSVVLEGTTNMPRANADDVEFIEAQLDIVAMPGRLAVPLEEIKTKLAVAD